MAGDYFQFQQFSVRHGGSGLKVTTDACVLGALAVLPGAKRILDIGTGNGVLALMAAQLHPDAEIVAVEMHPESGHLAQENFLNSPFRERISFIGGDIRHVFTGGTYDLIVCNPPYFRNHLISQQTGRNLAMHNFNLSEAGFMHLLASKMNDTAAACLIVPPYEAGLLMKAGEDTGLHADTVCEIYNVPGRHFRTFMRLRKFSYDKTITRLTLTDVNKKRTPEFSDLMKGFYIVS